MRIILILFALFSIGCKCPQIVEQTTVRDSIVYVDTTILIHDSIPYGVSIDIDSLIDALNSVHDGVIAESTRNGISTKLLFKDGRLICQATVDSLRHELELANHIKTIETVKNVLIEKPKSKFQIFLFYWFIGTIIVTSIYITLKLR